MTPIPTPKSVRATNKPGHRPSKCWTVVANLRLVAIVQLKFTTSIHFPDRWNYQASVGVLNELVFEVNRWRDCARRPRADGYSSPPWSGLAWETVVGSQSSP